MRDAPRPHGVTVNGVSTSEILLAHPRKVPVSAEENTRLVQSAYEAFGRGDMAALAEVMADDIEWVNPGDPDDNPNAGTFKGSGMGSSPDSRSISTPQRRPLPTAWSSPARGTGDRTKHWRGRAYCRSRGSRG
jgi:hypothetical protein